MKIPISKEQRRAVMLSLAAGGFNIGIFPELSERMPNTVAWFQFLSDISGEHCPPSIPLGRDAKIAALKCLRTGFFDLREFLPVIKSEESRNRFFDLMRVASVEE